MGVVIVGGGISGLSTAYFLRQAGVADCDICVLEAAARPGGHIVTRREDGWTVEQGPNGFLDNAPATVALVRDLGLASQCLPCDEGAATRFLYRAGRLRTVTANPLRLVTGGLLPVPGALRVLMEPLQRRGGHPEETVYDFAARRIGRAAADILVDAMVSGVFAGSARQLELCSAFPKMAAMEATYGSLVRAMLARWKATADDGDGGGGGGGGGPTGPGGRLTSFADGLATLTDTLAAALGGCVVPGMSVDGISKTDDGFAVRQVDGTVRQARCVVLAVPAMVAGDVLRELSPALEAELRPIDYPPVTVVATAFDRAPPQMPQSGFGFLVPRGQGLRILGCLWSSRIWPSRAPSGAVLLRTLVGGAHDPDCTRLPDDELVALVRRELGAAMGITVAPSRVWVFRHRHAIAQYAPGHAARLRRMDDHLERLPGLFLSGSAYRGISMNNCIDEARRLAPKLRQALETGRTKPM